MDFHGKAGVRKVFYLKPRHLADFTTHLQDTILQRVLQVQRGCTGGPKKVPKNKKKRGSEKWQRMAHSLARHFHKAAQELHLRLRRN